MWDTLIYILLIGFGGGLFYLWWRIAWWMLEGSKPSAPRPQYVLQKEWSTHGAKMLWRLYEDDIWEDGWSICAGYRVIGEGNLTWARKQATHFGLTQPPR